MLAERELKNPTAANCSGTQSGARRSGGAKGTGHTPLSAAVGSAAMSCTLLFF